MSAFNYIALNRQGSSVKGILEADSAKQVRQQLRAQGLAPLEVTAVSSATKAFGLNKGKKRGKRIKTADLSLLTRQLATLIGASLPIEEALQGVAEQTEKTAIKSIIHGVRAKVLEGHSLANALRNFPNAFPELYCATIDSGEQTGKLDTVLNRLADYTEQQQKTQQKIQQALIYPSLMICVSISIVSFLLIFVVPKIIHVFNTTGQQLPTSTLILIAISHVLQQYGVYILIGLAILLALWLRLLKQIKIRTQWHAFLLKLPLIGYIIKTLNTARYAHTLGILTAAGVSVLEAMQVAATLISNLPMQATIQQASQKVREGATINLALKQTGYFTPMTLHLVASGESSGRLADMLNRAANNQDQDIARIIETGLTLFEPFIILIMGSVVLFIVLAIMLPIFTLDQFTG